MCAVRDGALNYQSLATETVICARFRKMDEGSCLAWAIARVLGGVYLEGASTMPFWGVRAALMELRRRSLRRMSPPSETGRRPSLGARP